MQMIWLWLVIRSGGDMKTKSHKVALIVKKCVDLRLANIADAHFDYSPHVDKIQVYVTKINDYDKKIYSASCYLDSCFNSSENASNLDDMLQSLDDIYYGLGVG